MVHGYTEEGGMVLQHMCKYVSSAIIFCNLVTWCRINNASQIVIYYGGNYVPNHPRRLFKKDNSITF
jgi:formylmethanofuran dehydrogenase subunit B